MRSRNGRAALFALLLAASLLPPTAQAEATARAPEPATRLTITGSSTMAPLVAELARRYCAGHRHVQIDVQGGGSGRGGADAAAGRADIGMVSRALTAEEKPLFAFTLARDGAALAVHRDNPARGITHAELTALLTGKIANWQALGGRDAPIRLIFRPAGRGTTETILAWSGLQFGDIKAAAIAGDNAEALAALLADRDAVVVLSVGFVERTAMQGAAIRALALGGVAASSAEVRGGRYPLGRPLNLVTRTLAAGAARDFIGYALSREARGTIEQYDYVPYAD